MNREKIISLAQEMQRNLTASAQSAAEIERLVQETPPPPPPDIVLRHFVEIGNPNERRWPGATVLACHARGIRDMQEYDGRIHGGGGAWTRLNQGPVPVWSFGLDRLPVEEIILEEEIVQRFHVYDDRLWIAGKDPRQLPDSYVHVKSQGQWGKLGAVKGAFHLSGMAITGGGVYVVASYASSSPLKLLRYHASDRTWADVDKTGADVRFRDIIDFGQSVLIFGTFKDKPCIYQYEGGQLPRRIAVSDAFPGETERSHSSRLVHYQGGVLYGNQINLATWYLEARARKLYYLDANMHVSVVWQSGDEFLRDIVVRDGTVYIMTVVSERGDLRAAAEAQARIWRSSDLLEWSLAADCTLPAVPFSFEILGGTFFVALGMRGRGIPSRPSSPGYADVKSGTICELRA